MGIACKYTGTFMDVTGYGSANRAFATALHIAGVDVTTETVVQTKDKSFYAWEGALCESLSDRDIPYKIKIIHLTPDLYTKYQEKDKYLIGHLFWETDTLPKEWVEECNRMGEIWTSGPGMAKVFRNCGVKVPIFPFPQPIDITMADKPYRKFDVEGHKGYLFYNIAQWIERKNHKALLQAFWQAFEGRDDVSLLLKTFKYNYSEEDFNVIRDDVFRWKKEFKIVNAPKVFLTKQVMTTDEIMKLHTTGDCYITTDRGEGWDRVLQEALLVGKTSIATGRGGIHEYLNDLYYYKIPHKYINVTPDKDKRVKFYTSDQKWADVDVERLKQIMLFVFNKKGAAGSKGMIAKDWVKGEFSYHKVGNMMKERLSEISKNL